MGRHRFLRNKWNRIPSSSSQRSKRQHRGQSSATAAEETRGGAQNENDDEWEKRRTKRLRRVQEVKATSEYGNMSKLQEESRLTGPAPGTPDANDRELSKRNWEEKVMHWRQALKALPQ